MCECIKTLAEMGYVQPNLHKAGQYWLYPINSKGKTGKTAMLVSFCPSCGERLCDSAGVPTSPVSEKVKHG